MKICAIICEYNPFHNGHLYQIQEAKRLSGADALLCVMSGNFVQRGEAAIMDKFTRAKHAVLAGADAVIELPTVFATSNAELFAKGAIHLLSSIPELSTLCFGAEIADKELLLKTAELLNNEPKSVSLKIKELTDKGVSYAKARAEAWAALIPLNLLTSPNTILALEYTKAILENDLPIDILPIKRLGGEYNDSALKENFSSATAIRNSIKNGTNLASNLPEFVKKDLPNALENKLDVMEKYAVLTKTCDELTAICDCTEGLENALKKAAQNDESLVNSLTSTRYTSSRIRRIALQSLLKIDERTIRDSLHSPLYLRVLGVKKARKELLSALSEANFPLIARPRDESTLMGTAQACYAIDIFAEKVYGLLYNKKKEIDIFID